MAIETGNVKNVIEKDIGNSMLVGENWIEDRRDTGQSQGKEEKGIKEIERVAGL